MVAYWKTGYFPDKIRIVVLHFKYFRSVRAKRD